MVMMEVRPIAVAAVITAVPETAVTESSAAVVKCRAGTKAPAMESRCCVEATAAATMEAPAMETAATDLNCCAAASTMETATAAMEATSTTMEATSASAAVKATATASAVEAASTASAMEAASALEAGSAVEATATTTTHLDLDDIGGRFRRRHGAGRDRRHRLCRTSGYRCKREQSSRCNAEATDKTTLRIVRSDHRHYSCECRQWRAYSHGAGRQARSLQT
jgi:hypothetical protein